MSEINRIIPVYKPVGPTTFDLIRIFKKKTDFKGKIGHGGSLDPFACGLVLLLLGKATQQFEVIKLWRKVYITGIRLDAESTTGDICGDITINKGNHSSKIKKEQIEDVLTNFIGEMEQKVPPYSAAKFKGEALYKLARKGLFIEKSKKIKILNAELICYNYPLLTIKVETAGGVYIRQFAQDIAQTLGKRGFLYFLERTHIGMYTLNDCLNVSDLENFHIE